MNAVASLHCGHSCSSHVALQEEQTAELWLVALQIAQIASDRFVCRAAW